MTKKEKTTPELLSSDTSANSRRARIAQGSGFKDADVSSLTAEFAKMAKVFKKIGPMMSMMQGGEMQVDPMEMLGQMMGGMNKKQKKALQMSGMAGNFKAPQEKSKKKKSGKPSIKGFN